MKRPSTPTILAAAALAVALTGTPVGEAATRVVRRAAFATNAGAVNGIKASRTPRAGRLVPLDAHGKLPASVVPAGARGATGPQGPQGVQGPAGPSAATHWAEVNADGTVARSSAGVGSTHFGTGLYTVTFPASVEGCALLTSLGKDGFGVQEITGVTAGQVGVQTLEHLMDAGNVVWTYADEPFRIVAIC